MVTEQPRRTVYVKSLKRHAAILYAGDDPGNWCIQLRTGECMTVSEDDLVPMPQSRRTGKTKQRQEHIVGGLWASAMSGKVRKTGT